MLAPAVELLEIINCLEEYRTAQISLEMGREGRMDMQKVGGMVNTIKTNLSKNTHTKKNTHTPCMEENKL